MTEISKAPFSVELTPLEQFFVSQQILFPDRRKSMAYKMEVMEADAVERKNAYEREHPFIQFLLTLNTYWLVLGVFTIAALLILLHLAKLGVILLAVYAFFGMGLDYMRDEKKQKMAKKFWSVSPFQDFIHEYTGDVISRISGCHNTSGCEVTLFVFKVYHHSFSSRRFLAVVDTSDNENMREYICDFWDKPIPQVSFDNQWVNKSAELL